MKIFEKKRPLADFPQSLPYLSSDMLFVDIETTGLSPQSNPIYMIGTACMQDDCIYMRLFFAAIPGEESEILTEFMRVVREFTTIITFNGERFDIPYIYKRLKKNNIIPGEVSLNNFSSIDIYKAIRPFKKLLGLPSCKQKAIEELCGITRTDEMDGGRLISVYHRYTKAPSEDDEKLLILHNEDDVWGMVSILSVLSYTRVKSSNLSLNALEWDHAASALTARFSLDVSIPQAIRIREDAFYMIIEKDQIKIAFFTSTEPLRYYYPYPAQYVYLLREHTVIPKLLASAVPAEEKRPARSDECFSTVTGTFVAIDSNIIKKQPAWLKDKHILQQKYRDSKKYIKTDPKALDENLITSYTGLLLDQYLPG